MGIDARHTLAGSTASEQETDVRWGGYHYRAALPAFILCLLVSVIIVLGAMYLQRAYSFPSTNVRDAASALILFVWFVQAIRWAYCALCKTYRLTTRRLLIERTFSREPSTPVELHKVIDVRVEQTAIQRRFRVGRLRLTVQDRPVPVVIDGVYQPGDMAITLRGLIQEARDRAAETLNPIA